MRILVTGGAGFIGSWIARALHEQGHEVASADSLVWGRNQVIGVPTLVGDLADGRFARHVADAVRPEILVHCAADAAEGASFFRLDSVVRNNVMAYGSILEACLRHGLRKVVLFSSMAVYGEQRPPFDESMPLAPVDPYGVTKAAMEGITRSTAEVHGFSWCVLRPHNVFGERQDCANPLRNVVGIFINRALRGEMIGVFGDGLQSRAFSYIGDSIDCYAHAILTDAVDGLAVNVGGEEPVTVLDLARLVVEEIPGVEVVHLPDRHGEVKHAYSDHRLAKERLRFEERVGWRGGVRRMCAWARKTGPWEWQPFLVETPTKATPAHWHTQVFV